MIAAMEAGHPHLTTQKSFYVEISRARDSAELVTDDAAKLKEHLEQATGERISALERIEAAEPGSGTISERTVRDAEILPDPRTGTESASVPDKGREKQIRGERSAGQFEKQAEMDLEL